MDESIVEYIARISYGAKDFSEIQHNVLLDDLRVAAHNSRELSRKIAQAQAEADYWHHAYLSTQHVAG